MDDASGVEVSVSTKKAGCFKKLKVWFKNFDKNHLKRWFRYKYNPNEKRLEIADLFEQDA